MPRNVRNVWVDLDVDGRNPIATGPRSASGGLILSVAVRAHGEVRPDAIKVTSISDKTHTYLVVYGPDGSVIHKAAYMR